MKKSPPTLFLSSKNFLVLLLFNSRTLLDNENGSGWFNELLGQASNNDREASAGHAPLPLRFVFDALVLADGFAVLHGHLGLVGTHLFALSGIAEQRSAVQFRPAVSEEGGPLTVPG